MVSRREKMSKSYMKTREQVLVTQSDILSSDMRLSHSELQAVLSANKGPSVYDRLCAGVGAPEVTTSQFDNFLQVLESSQPLGQAALPASKTSHKNKSKKKKDVNGLVRKKMGANPYRKDYMNGAEERKSRSSSANSSMDTDSDCLTSSRWMLPNSSHCVKVFTSSEDEMPLPNNFKQTSPSKPSGKSKKASPKKTKNKKTSKSRSSIFDAAINRSSDDEKLSKDFDALLHNKTSPEKIKTNSSGLSQLMSLRDPLFESSEDETEITMRTKPPAAKVRNKKRGGRKEVPGSSDDEKPLPSTPTKRGGRAGRGKAVTSTNAVVKKSVFSDEEEDLPRPTYKLTTDEENSNDKASDIYELSSDKQESDENPVKVVEDIKDGIVDAQSCAMLKTKAAMKEFTPKIEEKISKKKGQERRSHRGKSEESEAPIDSDVPVNLFVPQRAAARKASELITSHNVGGAPAGAPSAASPITELPTETSKKTKASVKDEVKVTPEKSPSKSKRGRPPKDRSCEKAELRDEPTMAVKKSIFEAQEILHYVPMRQAAMKAAQNFKNKGAASEETNTPPLSSANDESFASKNKKISKPEVNVTVDAAKSPRRGRSARSTPSHSDSDSDEPKVETKRAKKEAPPREKAPRSMFSESEDENTITSLKKEKVKASQDEKSPEKKQLFRGNMFVREYQSSSENDEEKDTRFSLSNIKNSNTSSVRKSTASLGEKRSQRNHLVSSVRSDDLRREVENQEPDAGTHRKAPDKKLKTSEGRPEHGFQPPATARGESPRVRDLSSPAVRGARVCPSERQSRNVGGGGRGNFDEPLQESRNQLSPFSSSHEDSHPFSSLHKRSPGPTIRPNFTCSPSASLVSPHSPFPSATCSPPPTASPLRHHSPQPPPATTSPFPAIREALKSREKLQSPASIDPSKSFPGGEAAQEDLYVPLSRPSPHHQKEALRVDPRGSPSPCKVGEDRPNSRLAGNIPNFSVKEVSPHKRHSRHFPSDIDVRNQQQPPPPQYPADAKSSIEEVKESRGVEVSSKDRVEQPKDSGYKSAITTPEPVDRSDSSRLIESRYDDVTRIINEDVRTSSANSDYGSNGNNSSVSGSSSNSSNSSVVPGESSPVKSLVSTYDGKVNNNKGLLGNKRKTLSNVIDDMTKKKATSEHSKLSSPSHHSLSSSPLHSLIPSSYTSPHHLPAGGMALSPHLPSSPHSLPLPEVSVGQLLPTSVLTTCAPDTPGLPTTVSCQPPSTLPSTTATSLPPPVKTTDGVVDTPAALCDTDGVVASFKQQWRTQNKASPPRSTVDNPTHLPAHLAQLQRLTDYEVHKFLDLRHNQSYNQPLFNPFLSQDEFLRHSRAALLHQQIDSQQKLRLEKHPDLNISMSDVAPADSSDLNTPKKFTNSFIPALPKPDLSSASLAPETLQMNSISVAKFASHSSNFSGLETLSFPPSQDPPSSKSSLLPGGLPSASPGMGRPGVLSPPHKTPSSVTPSEEEIVVDNESPLPTDRGMSPMRLMGEVPPPATIPPALEPPPAPLDVESLSKSSPSPAPMAKFDKDESHAESPKSSNSSPYLSKSMTQSNKSLRQLASKASTPDHKLKGDSCVSSPPGRVQPITISLTGGGGSAHASPASHRKYSPSLSSPRSSRRLQEAAAAAAATPTYPNRTPFAPSDGGDISPAPLTIVSPKPSTPQVTPRSTGDNVYDVTDDSDAYVSKLNTPATTPSNDTSPHPKRVPIYMTAGKAGAKGPVPSLSSPEKKSPRSQGVSPRWVPKEEVVKKKVNKRGNQSGGKGGRGRGPAKSKTNRGRQSKIAVPKELVGTVYDFDFDDEFSDNKSKNQSTLDDLRMLREKRQSVDAPQPPTPTYAPEIKETPMPSYKKTAKERRGKGKEKESSPKQNEKEVERSPYGDVAPSLPQQSPKNVVPPVKLSTWDDKNLSSDSHYLLKNDLDYSSATCTATPSGRSGSDDRPNILKIKIKGPYANSYSTSAPVPPPEPEPSVPFRRMRKKELIRQYCNQDLNPPPTESQGAVGAALSTLNTSGQTGVGESDVSGPPGGVSGTVTGASEGNVVHPPPQKRAAFFLPKAVASMPTIPTREDYKRYRNPQEDNSAAPPAPTGRRRRAARDAAKTSSATTDKPEESEVQQTSKKRGRTASKEEDCSDAMPPAKLRISLSKKGSKVTRVAETTSSSSPAGGDVVTTAAPVATIAPTSTTVVTSSTATSDATAPPVSHSTDKLRPPKKRLAEEHPLDKIRNDNMRFREEIMNTFSKPKKGKKRKHRDGSSHSSGSEMRDDDMTKSGVSQNLDDDVTDVTVVSNESRKLVLRFSKSTIKTEPPDPPVTPTLSRGGSGNNSEGEVRATDADSNTRKSGSRKTHKTSSDEDNHSSNNKSKKGGNANKNTDKRDPPLKMMPLKLKLQRRPDGYTSAHPSLPGYSLLGQGPGPPVSQPLDPPASSMNSTGPSPTLTNSLPHPADPVPTSSPAVPSTSSAPNYDSLSSILCSSAPSTPLQNCLPRHSKNNNNNNNNKTSFHGSSSTAADSGDLGEDVLLRLEAELAATDGGGAARGTGASPHGSGAYPHGGGASHAPPSSAPPSADTHHHHQPNHTYKENSNAR